eukprot:7292230-Lingulodinium_polyedra.AAC.1
MPRSAIARRASSDTAFSGHSVWPGSLATASQGATPPPSRDTPNAVGVPPANASVTPLGGRRG